MTANENMKDSEPGRPAWVAGLDLSPARVRADDTLPGFASNPYEQAILRRLADAEMRVAELESELADARISIRVEIPARGVPDFLIDADGECWHRHASNGYRFKNGTSRTREYIEQFEGPVIEAWK